MEANNMAAMREALVQIVALARQDQPRFAIISTAETALAEPPRNCDVYDNESCRMAYHLHGDGHMTMQAFADWLFAPATEQKGENNGSK